MTWSAKRPDNRHTDYREARRRRKAADLLRLAEATSGYAVRQFSDGLSPQEAREAAIEAAGELEAVAIGLRRLAQLRLSERCHLAALLAGSGVSHHEVARRIGVSSRTVARYLGHP